MTEQERQHLIEQWTIRANMARMSGMQSVAAAIEQCIREAIAGQVEHQEGGVKITTLGRMVR